MSCACWSRTSDRVQFLSFSRAWPRARWASVLWFQQFSGPVKCAVPRIQAFRYALALDPVMSTAVPQPRWREEERGESRRSLMMRLGRTPSRASDPAPHQSSPTAACVPPLAFKTFPWVGRVPDRCGRRGLAPGREDRARGGIADARGSGSLVSEDPRQPREGGLSACETQHAAHGGSHPSIPA